MVTTLTNEINATRDVYQDLLTQSQTALSSMVKINKELLNRVRELSSDLDASHKFNRDTLNVLMADTNALLKEYGINNIDIPTKKENPLSIVPDKGADNEP